MTERLLFGLILVITLVHTALAALVFDIPTAALVVLLGFGWLWLEARQNNAFTGLFFAIFAALAALGVLRELPAPLMLVVGGEVSQQFLTLAEPVSQERLSQTVTRLNGLLVGLAVDDIAALSTRPDALDQDILSLVIRDMRRNAESISGEVYTDGLTNVLAEPEFKESEEARRALKIFGEPSTLKEMLDRTSTTTTRGKVGGLQVLIGGEGVWEELRECSMVIARYGVPGMATGTLGVFGPMRMAYGKTIPTVRYVAGLLSDLINDTISGD